MSPAVKERMQRTVSPVDGSVLLERALASERDVERALARSVEAQRRWKAVPVAERAAVCLRMAAWCVERADELGRELTRQMGRPIAHSPNEIRRGFQERAAYMAGIAEASLADLALDPRPGFRRFIRREPLGTVLAVSPWNYPWLTSVNAVLPALMAGNAVILKMALQTPLVAERYAEAFKAAGLPEGAFQYLHVDHAQVARIIGDERVGFIAFTGSVLGGEAVQRAASERFIATGLELGGKDPAYVRADAPLEATVENLVEGVYFNAGQSCCAVERIYVQRDLYPAFVERFVALTRAYRLGDPLDPRTTLGPVVRAEAADYVRSQVEEALAQGATAHIDPRDFPADRPGTAYVAPQVLTDVDHRMAIMTEETFGPAVGIMAVDGDEQAVELMNDSRFGLSASIWTADAEAALRIGERVETGTWFMNRCDYLDPALAWTGIKESGRGCTLSRLGFDAFTRPKSFHLRLGL
jgi:acyl-CoA reductase-like NAD-dependent aldehyde dehydrogenase